MALLAGSAKFILEKIIPRVKIRKSMLSIARMRMNWNADQLEQVIQSNHLYLDPKVMKHIRAHQDNYWSSDLYRLIGFSDYQDVDNEPLEGCSIMHDMNIPFSDELHNRFDLVGEVGTIEHIFDIKTAMANIASAVKLGGSVFHMSPMDAHNHGFYNFSLNFFYDFYSANGFGNFESYLVRGAQNWQQNQNVVWQALPYSHQEMIIPAELYASPFPKMAIAFVGDKIEHVQPVRVPQQSAYDPNKRHLENHLTPRETPSANASTESTSLKKTPSHKQ